MDNKSNIDSLSNEEIERIVRANQEAVIFHMDELRKLFAPHIRITFMARDPQNGQFPRYLSDDADVDGLIDSIKTIKGELKPIHSEKKGNA